MLSGTICVLLCTMQTATKIPHYRAILGPEPEDPTGIQTMSFVEEPATGSHFIALSSSYITDNEQVKTNDSPAFQNLLLKSEAKQTITGVVLIPNQKILRHDSLNKPFYISFSADVIEGIRNKFFRNGYTSLTSDSHNVPLQNNHLVESWIVENPKQDKALAIGLGELPKGTWLATYKINDAAYWQNEIQGGKRKGFSLEGLFSLEPAENDFPETNKPTQKPNVKMNITKPIAWTGKTIEKITEIIREAANIINAFGIEEPEKPEAEAGKATEQEPEKQPAPFQSLKKRISKPKQPSPPKEPKQFRRWHLTQIQILTRNYQKPKTSFPN